MEEIFKYCRYHYSCSKRKVKKKILLECKISANRQEIFCFILKGLSHEIDFKNVVENGQILALIRSAAGF